MLSGETGESRDQVSRCDHAVSLDHSGVAKAKRFPLSCLRHRTGPRIPSDISRPASEGRLTEIIVSAAVRATTANDLPALHPGKTLSPQAHFRNLSTQRLVRQRVVNRQTKGHAIAMISPSFAVIRNGIFTKYP